MAEKKKIVLRLMSKQLKEPFVSKENILAIYSPGNFTIPAADTVKIFTDIKYYVPKNSALHATTKFKGQQIQEIRGPAKTRLWLTLLSTSYFQKYVIKKGNIVGYVLSNDSHIVLQKYINKKKKHQIPKHYLLHTWDWKEFWEKKGVDVKPVDF